jgi:ATP:ADP antiporter, AAA family
VPKPNAQSAPSRPKPRPFTRAEGVKIGLLATWFFLTITTLWLLKPVRTASLLSHLGAAELPYLRFGSLIGVGLVVLVYSHLVNRLSRLDVVRGSCAIFASVLVLFWLAMHFGGAALGGQRWFVWAVFILVDIYSTVMVAIFWTYTNDVVSRVEADRLYGPIGIGGILGGIAGGVIVDTMVHWVGPVDLLLVCVALVLASGAFAWGVERILKPAARVIEATNKPALDTAFEGARQVVRSPYLLGIVGVVVAYEFAAALGDFAINVVFERAFQSETEIAQMYGRLGWIVSATALAAELVLVPLLLPYKRVALLVPPVAMALATLGLAALPLVPLAMLLAASDRGLNYSLQQVTKETLYVPLTDLERYKAKAFIDMFVDRGAKAMSSVALLIVIALVGVSIVAALGVAFVALMVWLFCANALGRRYQKHVSAQSSEKSEPTDGTLPTPA